MERSKNKIGHVEAMKIRAFPYRAGGQGKGITVGLRNPIYSTGAVFANIYKYPIIVPPG